MSVSVNRDRTYVRTIALKRDRIADPSAYPFSLPAVRNLDEIELHPSVTFFVGENGSGKSTLLEALAVHVGVNAEGGSQNFSFSTRASHSCLHEYLRVAKGVARPRDRYFLRAESYFNVASEIERLGQEVMDFYGGTSLHEQSHGESFLALLRERFFGDGLYLLDEPEAALSPVRQLSVLALIHDLVQRRGQFIIATHSPILMSYPHATIYHFTQDGVRPIAYEETEHYRVTRDFLNRRDMMLAELLGEE